MISDLTPKQLDFLLMLSGCGGYLVGYLVAYFSKKS